MDLCLIAAGEFSWLSPASWLAILQVALGLGAVIFVHELGHFLVAKACGVKCEKFYLGFDAFDIKIGGRVIIPRSLLKWQWGETVYGIGILPLGGYVKMLGQDDNPANTAKERERSRLASSESPEGLTESARVEELPAGGPIDRSELDPRSYQAKTVLQRMAIISAGVIMNLIFAVVFATIAFWNGVPYMPPVIGATMPGGPAYVANIGNTEVLKADGVDTQRDYYPFEYLQESILLNGGKQPIEFVLKVPGQAEPLQKTLTPQLGLIPQRADFAALGFGNQPSTSLGEKPTIPHSAASQAEPAVAGGDKFVAIEGAPITSIADADRMFARNPEKALSVTFERKAKPGQGSPGETYTALVPPHPMVEFGIALEIGPIIAIQESSPAAESELKVGDLLQAIDGQPLGDPLTIQLRLLGAAREGRSVQLTVQRPGEEGQPETRTIECRTRLPDLSSWRFDAHQMAIESLGFAVKLTNVVAEVVPDSSAAQAGIRPGDELTHARFLLSPAMAKDPIYQVLKDQFDFQRDHIGWATIVNFAQDLRPPQAVEITLRRNRQPQTVTVTPAVSEKLYLDDYRGFVLTPIERKYRAPSLWDAFQLGIDRTRRDMGRVLKFLNKLVRGEIGVKNLGGPGTIAVVATSEASYGASRLLLFLTLLSANLAIVNFLPIPVLDGGHMMFLAYEGIFRKPVNERVQLILMYAGLLFIVCLMLLVIFLDVYRFAF
jgi:regulator of sigma E protease